MKKFKFRNIVAAANRKLPIGMAAIVLSGSTLVSALLGIFRDRLLNGDYLATYPTGIDAYTVAFTIPDFMFFVLVSGALSVTFIPVFNQRLKSGNKKSAWELSSSMVNFLALITLIASVLIMIFAEPLVKYVVGPGLDEATTALAVSMMRVIAVNPFLFSITTVITSMQQAVGRFVLTALAPAVYNIGIIIGIVFFTNGINIFGVQIFEGGIMGVALGVALGSVMQLLISVLGLAGLGFDYDFKIRWRNKGFRKALGLLPARSLDQGIDYVNGLVEINMASRMASGTVRSYQQALSLHQMPISLIGTAIASAYYPKMTEDLAENDGAGFRKDFRSALSMIVWIAAPVATVAFFARGYVVSFIVNGGNMLIASILGFLVLSIFCRCVFQICSRGFYAQQDTKTPLLVSILAIGLNIVMAVTFTLVFNMGPLGLAIAQSVGAIVEVSVLLFILNRRVRGILTRGFWQVMSKVGLATIVTGAVSWGMARLFSLRVDDEGFWETFPKFCLITVVSLGAYLGMSFLLRMDEVKPVMNKVKYYAGKIGIGKKSKK